MELNGWLGTRAVAQIGIVVRDIEKAAKAFAQLFGVSVPAWFKTEPYETAKTEYRGRPTPARAKLAFFDLGSLQLELIEPDEHPSTWREHLDTRGEGIHHIAFFVENITAKTNALEQTGMRLLQKGEYPGGRYVYLDGVDTIPCILELLENDRGIGR